MRQAILRKEALSSKATDLNEHENTFFFTTSVLQQQTQPFLFCLGRLLKFNGDAGPPLTMSCLQLITANHSRIKSKQLSQMTTISIIGLQSIQKTHSIKT
tara:strand:- start:51 stop:350 length:300 start_codon:yes stop_codon:yes gene_type:complete